MGTLAGTPDLVWSSSSVFLLTRLPEEMGIRSLMPAAGNDRRGPYQIPRSLPRDLWEKSGGQCEAGFGRGYPPVLW